MRDVIRMWKYTNMIALTAISAGIYTAALIPFKTFSLIPGFTEIRPACFMPEIFGLLFGPAGAWGSAFGNIFADLFGTTFSIASVFGFAGNFLSAYIPYKLWDKLKLFQLKDTSPNIDSGKKLMIFGLITIVASFACALIISWGTEALKLVPFARLSSIIILNNTTVTLLLGPVFLSMLYPRIKKSGLFWTDIMKKEDISISEFPAQYANMTIFSTIGGILAGFVISAIFLDKSIYALNPSNTVQTWNANISLGVLPFIIIMFYSISKL